MRGKRWLCRVTLALCLATPTAYAEPEWNFSGFASIGAGKINEESLTFFDYDEHWSFDSDSMLALQGIVEATDKLSFTGQVISKGFTFDERSPYEPELNWLFASYEVSHSLRVRGGRLRTPLFLYSESLETGFSYPWVRPPVAMYAHFLEPFANFDGFDATWFNDVAGYESEFSFFAGTTKDKYRGRDVDLHKTWAFTAQTQLDALKLRYCYSWNRISITNPNLEDAAKLYRTFASVLHAPIFNEIADSAALDAKVFQYHALGLQWERDGWQWIAEKFLTVGPGKQYSFENDGWYVSLARQINAFMPYLTIGEYSSEIDPHIAQRVTSSYSVVPAGAIPLLDTLRSQTFIALEGLSVTQGSTALGVRYEVSSTSALKFEAEYFNFNSTGQMTFDENGEEPKHAVATTIVFDVVF